MANWVINKIFEGEIRTIWEIDNVFSNYLEGKEEEKIERIAKILQIIINEKLVGQNYFKKLEGYSHLWEIRIQIDGKAHRYYCCYEINCPNIYIIRIIGGKKSKEGLRPKQFKLLDKKCSAQIKGEKNETQIR